MPVSHLHAQRVRKLSEDSGLRASMDVLLYRVPEQTIYC